MAVGDLLQHRVGALDALYYQPEWVSEAEERQLLSSIRSSQSKWVQLSGRRLQNHGGVVHAKGLIPAPLPAWLQAVADRVHAAVPLFGDKAPNHVLINAYRPGEGIMPHEDGPLYLPVVAILSLGGPAVLRFFKKQATDGGGDGGPTAACAAPEASLLAQPRSLLVFSGDAYERCLHGIDEVTSERLDDSIVNLGSAGGQPPPTAEQPPPAAGSSRPSGDAPAAPSSTSLGEAGALAGQQLLPGHLPEPPVGQLQQVTSITHRHCDHHHHHHHHQQQQQQQESHAEADPPVEHVPSAVRPAGGGGPGATGCAAALAAAAAAGSGVLPRGAERVSLTVRHVLQVHRGLMVGRR